MVVAETKLDDHDGARAARSTTGSPRCQGCHPDDVLLVGPGTLPKTSSGKLQRGLCRQRYVADELVQA